MRIQVYLRVLSNETTIRALHCVTNIPNASIKQLKSQREGADNRWWNWQTERVPIEMENPDDGFRALLLAHRPIFPLIKRLQGPEGDIYLEVITQYEKGEELRG